MNYAYAAAGALILVFIFLILQKKRKNKADYYLIAVNIMVGSFMLADVLVNSKLTSGTVIFQNGVPLFLFPVFVLYVLQFTHARKRIQPYWYLMFMPGLLFACLSITDHYLLKNYPNPAAIEAHFNTPSIWYQLIFKGSQLLFMGILLWLLRALAQFEQEIKAGFSSIETIEVRWLRNFTWIYLGSIAITFVLFLGQNLGLIPFEIKQVFAVVYGILILSVFYINYEGIKHYTLSQIEPQASVEQASLEEISQQQISKKSIPLSTEEQQIEQQMLSLIEEKKLYLEPKFSLKELAGKLGKSTHQISRIINAQEGRSFYDLINGYRVNHLKNLLDDPKNSNFTILALGLDSGFNSKASLNRIFKQISGLTPRQYLNQKSQSIG